MQGCSVKTFQEKNIVADYVAFSLNYFSVQIY